MNNGEQEKLFTDLTPTQAETTIGGSPPVNFASVSASYGKATALFQNHSGMFYSETLYVKDTLADGHPVYAMFQGQPSDGSSILTVQWKRFDRKGAAAREGTFYDNLVFPFSKNISKLRLVIMRDNPGRDLFVAGPWVDV